MLALVVAWLAASAVLFVWPRTDATPRHADVVVVLSGARNLRLDPGLALVRRGVAPLLAISGVEHDPKWLEARRLCRYGARGFRVLCFEPRPFSTRGEARAIARLARVHRWSSVVVVTSRYHVTRARLLFRRCYHGRLAVVGVRYPLLRLPEEVAFEWAKLLTQLTVMRGC